MARQSGGQGFTKQARLAKKFDFDGNSKLEPNNPFSDDEASDTNFYDMPGGAASSQQIPPKPRARSRSRGRRGKVKTELPPDDISETLSSGWASRAESAASARASNAPSRESAAPLKGRPMAATGAKGPTWAQKWQQMAGGGGFTKEARARGQLEFGDKKASEEDPFAEDVDFDKFRTKSPPPFLRDTSKQAPRTLPRESIEQPLTPPRQSDPTGNAPLSPSSSSSRARSPKPVLPSHVAIPEEGQSTSNPTGLTVRTKPETTADDGDEAGKTIPEEPAAMKKFTGIKGANFKMVSLGSPRSENDKDKSIASEPGGNLKGDALLEMDPTNGSYRAPPRTSIFAEGKGPARQVVTPPPGFSIAGSNGKGSRPPSLLEGLPAGVGETALHDPLGNGFRDESPRQHLEAGTYDREMSEISLPPNDPIERIGRTAWRCSLCLIQASGLEALEAHRMRPSHIERLDRHNLARGGSVAGSAPKVNGLTAQLSANATPWRPPRTPLAQAPRPQQTGLPPPDPSPQAAPPAPPVPPQQPAQDGHFCTLCQQQTASLQGLLGHMTSSVHLRHLESLAGKSGLRTDRLLPHIADGVLVYVADTQQPPQPAPQQAQPAMQNQMVAAKHTQVTGPPGRIQQHSNDNWQNPPDMIFADLLSADVPPAPEQATYIPQNILPTQQQGMSAYNATQQAIYGVAQNYPTAQQDIGPAHVSSQQGPAAAQASCPTLQHTEQYMLHYHQQQAAALQHLQQMAQHTQQFCNVPQQHYPTAQQLPYGFLQQHSHQLQSLPQDPTEQQCPYSGQRAQGPGLLPQPSVQQIPPPVQQFRPPFQATLAAKQSSPNLLAPQQQSVLPQQRPPELLASQQQYELTQRQFSQSQQHTQMPQPPPSQMMGTQQLMVSVPQKPAAQEVGLEDLLPAFNLSGGKPSSAVDYLEELLGAVGSCRS